MCWGIFTYLSKLLSYDSNYNKQESKYQDRDRDRDSKTSQEKIYQARRMISFFHVDGLNNCHNENYKPTHCVRSSSIIHVKKSNKKSNKNKI
jgi:hypothetical protein